MSAYTSGYSLRYDVPSIHQQAEYAVVTAADQVRNEAEDAPNHATRLRWAGWASEASAQAVVAFLWPIAMNPSIQNSIISDPTGASVTDSDVQFVVNSNLEFVIANWAG